jgi:hypothetical protein
MMPRLLPRVPVFFRYIGPDETMRKYGLGWAVYEEGGEFFRTDTLERIEIDPRLYVRETQRGFFRIAWGFLKYLFVG